MGWNFDIPDDEWQYNALSEEEHEQLRKADEEKLEAIAAYNQGYEYGLNVHLALKPFMEAVPGNEEPDDDLLNAYGDCLVLL